MNIDERWMHFAIEEAIKAENIGEVPVGAIIIKNEQIIAKAHNMPILKNDPTAHAEILAIRRACKKIQNYRLIDTTLYVTLEPCNMCLGAIIHARVSRIIFGAFDSKTGACGSSENLKSANFIKYKSKIYGGILEKDCQNILQKFFKERR
ncbi:tRNA adenosine(34) deaminase TadA [Candidatus Pseudothioglobus singularis]|jgi:tRNA(adenine34) deaminase|nr:tRNA adenosine(34) deaminase TadA [Candidatus Pseudothioglobus singularis]